jgi:hypothetical protein
MGLVELDWGIYSLELANLPEGKDPVEIGSTGHSAPALRASALIRERKDSQTMGRFYHALGIRAWEIQPPMDMMQAVREAIEEVGFDGSLLDDALADPGTWLDVMKSHEDFVTSRKAIGVPTLVLDGDDGPVIFGPVIDDYPTDEETVELWEHVSWLMRYQNFAEMKRRRKGQPDLVGFRYPVSERTFGNKMWLPVDHPANT